MSNYLILAIMCAIIVLGIINKVNCFDSFLVGAKEGMKTTVNMFSNLLVFMVALSFLLSSGFVEFITKTLNFEYSLLVVQSFVRPLSSSASLSIVVVIYDTYGVDSQIGLLSTMIHYVSDATLYIVPFYCGLYQIKKYDKIIVYGLIVNIISYIISIAIVVFFMKIM